MKLFGNRPSRPVDPEDLSEEEWDESEAPDTEFEEDDEELVAGRRGIPNGVIMAISAILVLVLVAGAGVLIVNYFLSLINYQAADSDYFPRVEREEELPEETAINDKLAAIDEEEAGLEATPEELAQWQEHIDSIVSDDNTYEVPITESVYNILLIGSDTREAGSVGRSDAMILVSINQATQTIYLTSFLRDCYVYVPGWGHTRLNHAFAYEGPALLEETLEENFKVHVDKYIAVDFFSFMDIVDILGGIWIYVTEDEMEITNDYIWSMNKLLGEDDPVADYLWEAGWHKLNGKQALCYARNRYTGNDYQRTQRQRNLIYQVISGAKMATPATLVDLAQVILPQITTDMDKAQILSYVANIGAYMDYQVVSQQIPAADTYHGATIDGMSVISLDLDDNIEYLQGTIYAGTEYGFPVQEQQSEEDFDTVETDDEE